MENNEIILNQNSILKMAEKEKFGMKSKIGENYEQKRKAK